MVIVAGEGEFRLGQGAIGLGWIVVCRDQLGQAGPSIGDSLVGRVPSQRRQEFARRATPGKAQIGQFAGYRFRQVAEPALDWSSDS